MKQQIIHDSTQCIVVEGNYFSKLVMEMQIPFMLNNTIYVKKK